VTGVGGIHHRPNVVHPSLERRQVADVVGKACSPLIEEQHAREARELRHPLDELGSLPGREHVVNGASDPDDIPRLVADHLVGDRDAAATSVFDVRDSHCPDLPTRKPRLARLAPFVPAAGVVCVRCDHIHREVITFATSTTNTSRVHPARSRRKAPAAPGNSRKRRKKRLLSQ
jgi:hypothetical protein